MAATAATVAVPEVLFRGGIVVAEADGVSAAGAVPGVGKTQERSGM